MWVAMRLSPLPSPCPAFPPGPAPGSRLEADVDLLRDLHRLALDPGHDLLPPRLAPDLEAGAHPRNHDVLVDRRVLAQRLRQADPPLPIHLHVPRGREEKALEVPLPKRQPSEDLLNPGPPLFGVDPDTVVESPGDDNRLAQFATEPGREYDPSLLVQGVAEFATEHPHTSPLYSTCSPPSPKVLPEPHAFFGSTAGSHMGRGFQPTMLKDAAKNHYPWGEGAGGTT